MSQNKTAIEILHVYLWYSSFFILTASSIDLTLGKFIFTPISFFISFMLWITKYMQLVKNEKISNPANLITVGRGLLLLSIPFYYYKIPFYINGILIGVICTMDMLDGYIARKLKCESTLGEYLDKETDAALVLIVSMILYFTHYSEWWILIPGIIRYVYFIFIRFVIKPNRKEIKFSVAKYIAIILFVSLIAVFFIPNTIGNVFLKISTILVTFSFTWGGLKEADIIK